jgi:succinoglycan biosynthesis protein ExoV
MKLFYHKDPVGNFGDDLNPWLWPRLLPGLLDDDESSLFVGIGTILDERIPHAPAKVVFGTGVGYGRLPAVDGRWRICCVRGPLTARALGLSPELAITDPAVLVKTVLPDTADAPRQHRVSFMPHHRTKIRASEQGIDLQAACASADIYYIDPAAGVDSVLRDIASSEMLIAEAMHGAIVADALRIPWLPVKIYDHIRDLKWRDWCSSLDLAYRPIVYLRDEGRRTKDEGPITHYALRITHYESTAHLARFLAQRATSNQSYLSDEAVLGWAVERLQERLERLKRSPDLCGVIGSADFAQDPEVLRGVPWFYEVQVTIRDLSAHIPPGKSFILVDEGQWAGDAIIVGRQAIPFLEREGRYWGRPADDATAIRELERLREAGADFIAFVWPAFWWLDHYSHFSRYLRAKYPRVLENERVVLFSL